MLDLRTLYFLLICVIFLSGVSTESQVAYEGDPVDLHCDNTYIPLEGETPVTEYLTSWFKLTDSRTDEDKTLIARHTGQRNVHIAEKYDGRGLELYLRDGRLTIPEIQVGDEGRYLCTGAYREPQETELVVKVHTTINITVDCGTEEVIFHGHIPRIRLAPSVHWELNGEGFWGQTTVEVIDAAYDVMSVWTNVTYDVINGPLKSVECVVSTNDREWREKVEESTCPTFVGRQGMPPNVLYGAIGAILAGTVLIITAVIIAVRVNRK